MEQLSKIIPIFEVSFVNNIRLHRGERLSFNPSENLENSMRMGKKFEGCFSCSSIYQAYSAMEFAHVNSCRCELIFILIFAGIPEPSDKESQEGSHSLCIVYQGY